ETDRPRVLAPRCLVVDDDPHVRRSIARVVQALGLAPLEAAGGEAALQLLATEGEVPLVISDINMPGVSGLDLLDELQRSYPETAVLMLSGVSDVTTAVMCLDRGALDYIAKPALVEEVRARVAKALEKRELLLQRRFYQRNLELRVRTQATRIKELFLQGVQTLAHALEAKDAYTSGHSMRVSRYAARTAVRLGLTGERLEEIRLGAELHDIGKIGTREAVLNKPGPLSEEEFRHITEHTVLGERILAPLARENPTVLQIVRSHHERMDGRGFPDGLAGAVIPFEARIVCVVDAFDAMTTNRAYRESRGPFEAMEELRRCAGSHFDPDVVEAFQAAHPDAGLLPISV
ncbi:MAG TPA: HD domain-containing phosphohydrolase, partial [Gemmatimonadales bacterium]|nr:HD domain-containing phosphohydrolase [Gemmatimonadales bacterium]